MIDPDVRAAQDAACRRAAQRRWSDDVPPSARGPHPWAHVPLAELFSAYNTVQRAAGGRLECGHEPVHTSSSGCCVTIDPVRGLWYCRSCHAGGGAVQALMSLEGLEGRAGYREAARLLSARYGAPQHRSRRRARRRSTIAWRTHR